MRDITAPRLNKVAEDLIFTGCSSRRLGNWIFNPATRVQFSATPPSKEHMESTRAARVEQRRILGEYYRDLATNYSDYHQLVREIGPTMAWPSKPNVPEFENS